MNHRSEMIRLSVLVLVIFCLAQSGCEAKKESPAPQQEQKQAAAPGGAQPGAAVTPAGSPTPTAEPSKSEPTEKAAAQPAPRSTTLAAGTTIAIVTSSTLSTQANKSGEAFGASLAQDISDGDWVIAKKGANVTGVITDSDPGGRVKGVASITVHLTKITAADGQEIPISTSSVSVNAKSSKKKDAAKIGIGAGVGAAIGAIAGGGKGAAIGAGVGGAAGTGAVLATHGDPAIIRSETRLNFKLKAPVEVTEKR